MAAYGKEIVDGIREDRRNGMSFARIAAKRGVSDQTARAYGCNVQPRVKPIKKAPSRLTLEQRAELVRDFDAGVSARALANRYDCAVSHVRAIIRGEAGRPIR